MITQGSGLSDLHTIGWLPRCGPTRRSQETDWPADGTGTRGRTQLTEAQMAAIPITSGPDKRNAIPLDMKVIVLVWFGAIAYTG
jgi:hypothetical protein